ncbi:U-box domain-containing protein 9-like [Impatiens glandulifera]|uniref:U-box domain-containing protein 9-like n=1 Tax=Impatiens glandulifera TaxID=253017 RepID=UPI001FB09482|nr:U-box domain-containing protein 9-like [Impatiens glandulifera]
MADETVAPPNQASDLKFQLTKLVDVITETADYSIDTIDHAIRVLSSLRNSNRQPEDSLLHFSANPEQDSRRIFSTEASPSIPVVSTAVPEVFRCPISGELMMEPVVLASGQTYDRPFIQKWLKHGKRTCPLTQKMLNDPNLTPNHLVRELILQWCKENDIDLSNTSPTIDDEAIMGSHRARLDSLLLRLSSSSLHDKKEAAKELRSLTKRMPQFRALFCESPNSLSKLLSPMSSSDSVIAHLDLREDLITTILNISIHEDNKKPVAEHPLVIPFLVDSLCLETDGTRRNAAATLFTLSALDSNKILIGKSGAMKHLLNLLDERNELVMKDAASAIFNLCLLYENKGRAIQEGAVHIIWMIIEDGILVDELLAILASLSTRMKAVKELIELGVVPHLLRVIKETTSEGNKENAIAIIYAICLKDKSVMLAIKKEENANGLISGLLTSGTSRAKRKAHGILERLL